ncbi:hypothetical protein SAMD00079811_01920 [Scytonema sp. HK-05]|uniref:hypothetical protein n=1 Tax=Scytonema sp. HK-05 TaxID=1137095 RepID=UPI0009361056|nr:hypothetical protein [Scytonema sp. HK-05]OKH59947.1 hypothetical protein NIES2130_05645 [Scytonema sp. HK-05]BAY42614.1 hypothetical protein SAMD00079811_01920 [Scytonema sp. HK-05]
MSEIHKNQHIASKVVGSIFVLTGFVSLATDNGLVSQLAKSLDQYLMPVTEAKVSGSEAIAVADQQLIKVLGSDTLLIQGQKAVALGSTGEHKVLPDGYYKLSNGQMLKVQDGQVTRQSTEKFDTDKIARPSFMQCIGKGTWGRACVAPQTPDGNTLASKEQSVKVSVRDTLSQILDS